MNERDQTTESTEDTESFAHEFSVSSVLSVVHE